MSRDDAPAAGPSARVVEESYLALQDALRSYRLLTEFGENHFEDGVENPTARLQQECETFFELLRPYVEGEPALREYWEGSLAAHPDEFHPDRRSALEYYAEHSVGIWQRQEHYAPLPDEFRAPSSAADADSAPQAVADGGSPATPREWADALGVGGLRRIVSLDRETILEYRFSVLGLRDIKDWTTTQRTVTERGTGFMSGETSSATEIDPEPAPKVVCGARMLIDAARELGAIAGYEVQDTREAGFDYTDLI